MLMSLSKFWKKIPKLWRMYRMSVKDIEEWTVLRSNLDVCLQKGWGGGGPKLRLFCGDLQ